ncbi:MAG: right-handed parallel beta-helix repeat-containing protein [Actinobacteria bacterium]|nr:right-handed parallel beta-helix repeat-containing protein [Actinomycetota bacterium]
MGIHLLNVQNSRVKNGLVRGFDAGIVVEGGSSNWVTGVIARDNINDLTGPCELGDGILTVSSDDNIIEGNTVVHNGPYSGVSLVLDSDDNQVRDNIVDDSNVPNILPHRNITGPCGAPFSRPIQDIGIRVEGPGANNNIVSNNRVTDSAIGGITIHGYVCHPPTGGTPADPNSNNSVLNNSVSGTGGTTYLLDPLAVGIAVFSQGPLTVTCVAFNNTISGNNSSNNFLDGINLNARTSGNRVENNTTDNNLRDGLRVSGPPMNTATVPPTPIIDPTTGQPFPGATNNTLTGNSGHGNVEWDGADLNENCDNNRWRRSDFGTVNQPCVDPDAIVVPPPPPPAAATAQAGTAGTTTSDIVPTHSR